MEKNNNGIIGLYESRDAVNAMKKLYHEEYMKIDDEERKINKTYRKTKWRINLGTFAGNIGLLFAPKEYRPLGFVGLNFGSFVTKEILKYRNNKQKKNYKAKKDKLEADFINGTGIFEKYSAINYGECLSIDAGMTK